MVHTKRKKYRARDDMHGTGLPNSPAGVSISARNPAQHHIMEESEHDACHRCGAEADGEVDGKPWCAGCLHIEGSCCAGNEPPENP